MYFTYAFTYDLHMYLHIYIFTYIYIFTFIFTYTFYTYDYTCMYRCIYVYFTLSPYTETTSAISLVRYFFSENLRLHCKVLYQESGEEMG